MLEINKDNFADEVIHSPKPVIVDFWGPQCQPCLKLMPEVEALAETYKDEVKVVKINSAQNRRLCIEQRVMGLPTFLAFKNGAEVKRISGSDISKEDIENLIAELIS